MMNQLRTFNILMRLTLLFAGLLIAFSPLQAQIKKGEKLLNEGRYDEAVKALKKDFFGKKRDPRAGYLLAQSHYQLHNYEDARDVMELIQDQTSESTEMALFYVDVLIANEDFSGAYLDMLRLLSEDESNPLIYIWFQKINDLLRWDSVETGSVLRPIAGINTVYNEYAPYVNRDGNLWYVTDINSMQAIFPASYSGQNIHLIYKTKYEPKRSEVGKPSMLIKNRKYFDHDGPLAEWPGHNLYAISMRDIDAPVETSRVGIYFLDISKAADPTPFKYNESYNTGHPTFNDDGTRMFFTSDRPGGFGQMDIWYCDWKDGQWSLPVNMGPIINSPSNEVFPRYVEGRLYLSSDRRDRGYGALDIYYASEMLQYRVLNNMRQPINSAYDDFAISMADYNMGFITSNRRDGAGGDDVYNITFFPERIEHQERMARFRGKEITPGTRVVIEDGSGEVAKESVIIEENLFSLAGLKSKETYFVKLIGLNADAYELLVLDDEGEVSEIYISIKGELFRIELLDPQDYSMGREKVEDVSMDAFFDIKGKLQAEEPADWSETRVLISTLSGKSVADVKSETSGEFSFSGLNFGEEYVISTSGGITPNEIDLYGKSGAITQTILPGSGNSFKFTRAMPAANWMRYEPVEIERVHAVVLSETAVLPSMMKLNVVDSQQSNDVHADEDGFVTLASIKSLQAYELHITQGSLKPSDRLVLLGADGDTSQTVRPFNDKTFKFECLLDGVYEKSEPAKPHAAAPAKVVDERVAHRAEITDFNYGENTALILTCAEDNRIDTVYARANGTLVLRGLVKGQAYRLTMLDKQLNKNSRLRIFDENGNLLLDALPDGENGYAFVFLDQQDFGLEQIAVEDVAMETMNFSGVAEKAGHNERLALKILSSEGALITEGYTARDGKFSFQDIPADDKFFVEFTNTVPDALFIDLSDDRGVVQGVLVSSKRFLVDLNAQPLVDDQTAAEEPRREFTVPHVYYNFNSYYLHEDSRKSLEMLTRYLKQNPEVSIEIRSYTDSRGAETYNELLSERRANAVKEFLVNKGISAKRLSVKGFGESALVNHCKDGVPCTEEEHAVNRRTTFVVLND